MSRFKDNAWTSFFSYPEIEPYKGLIPDTIKEAIQWKMEDTLTATQLATPLNTWNYLIIDTYGYVQSETISPTKTMVQVLEQTPELKT